MHTYNIGWTEKETCFTNSVIATAAIRKQDEIVGEILIDEQNKA